LKNDKKTKPKLTGNLTTILSGNGNIKAYLHRFNISDERTCSCREGDQTSDHIFYDCARLKEERDRQRGGKQDGRLANSQKKPAKKTL
jgi:hypothetical protein